MRKSNTPIKMFRIAETIKAECRKALGWRKSNVRIKAQTTGRALDTT